MQKCTADGIYLYMEIIFWGSCEFTLFLFICCLVLFVSRSRSNENRSLYNIVFFLNRIRCKYGCGDDEDWKNYEIDMYSERYQAQSLSRVNRNRVHWYKLFHLKDKGSTVWSITKVGAMKPHTGVPNSPCMWEVLKLIHHLILCDVVIYKDGKIIKWKKNRLILASYRVAKIFNKLAFSCCILCSCVVFASDYAWCDCYLS